MYGKCTAHSSPLIQAFLPLYSPVVEISRRGFTHKLILLDRNSDSNTHSKDIVYACTGVHAHKHALRQRGRQT